MTNPEDLFTDLPEVLKAGEIAKALRVTTSTIREAISRGELAAFKLRKAANSSWRIHKADVVSWLAPTTPNLTNH